MNCEDKTAMKITAGTFVSLVLVASLALVSTVALVRAQVVDPVIVAQAPPVPTTPAPATEELTAPGFHFAMVPATIVTINYQHRMGATDIGFAGTPIESFATGHAEVSGKVGRIQIDAEFSKLDPATNFGPEYLTYVLWAITPEGKANNLGEILLKGDTTRLNVTTSLQTFGLIVTAEPYFAVSQPSNVVVLQNVVTPSTVGPIEQAPVSYQLLSPGAYAYQNSSDAPSAHLNPKTPLEFFEAENAVQIAINAGAQKYAPDALDKAQTSLTNAQQLEAHHGDTKIIEQDSRDAVQNAADARRITIQAEIAEEQAAEKAAAAARVAASKAAADAAAAAEQQAELQKAQAERDAAQAAAAQAQAQAAQAQAQAAQATAEAQAAAQAQAAQLAQQQAAQAAAQAAAAQQAAAQAEAEKEQLRATLLAQFNKILPTVDTPQGLKVNMADVLFAFGKFDLKPAAREALAKLSGIVLGHPGLKLAIDGYTDSVGSDAFNQTLSEKRAEGVRDYLVQQGLDADSVTAAGFGKANPVASNSTAAGRQQNRRVEIIISGEVIGTEIGAPAAAAPDSAEPEPAASGSAAPMTAPTPPLPQQIPPNR
jgi:outer membrane protein OmpA-like peptidoglycan-associated protein